MGCVPRSVLKLAVSPYLKAHLASSSLLSTPPGDAISVDLLLRHSASTSTSDSTGLTPLHWAVVKGNKVCIRRLVEAGADLDAKDDAGKTPRDMAEELKSVGAYKKGMEEAGRHEDGRIRSKWLSPVRLERSFLASQKRAYVAYVWGGMQRSTKNIIFVLPAIFMYLIALTLSILPWYSGPFLALALFYSMHMVRLSPLCTVLASPRSCPCLPRLTFRLAQLIVKGLLDVKTGDAIAKSPYFASIIGASIFWVGQCWATRLVWCAFPFPSPFL